ncbi:DNA polymerase IV [Klugiella xanthotipulae]|uniref:DNA polymerase IV n=1 Tax=Klugiella xanthotipulae TaxID=244735 RepID=A0A543HRZ8_9MICO|nr:DNA polymerase IV [Klugiella xanthotipulae]TQM61108.1 DNA polymerase-4 [Klugiella xanthotipulae]
MTHERSEASILHIDLDAFFASVELLDKPELRGQPAVVASPTGRSVVTSATYEARRFGIHSAQPLAQAQRLCPHVIVLPPHMELYREASRRVMAIFRDITPLVEQLSIDEAFLDVAGARHLFGSPAEIAALVRARVRAGTGLTCSVGAASTKFVAKVASQRAKPNGVLVIEPHLTLDFLHPLPVGALWGVGGVTGEHLRTFGVKTIGDLAELPLGTLQRAVGDASARALHELAHGRDLRLVTPERDEKSISNEVTFEYDVADAEIIRRQLLQLSLKVGARLRTAHLVARTVGIKLRWDDFRTITRSRTLGEPTSVGRQIYTEAAAAFDELKFAGRRVRLVGVRAGNLVAGDGASAALWDPYERWREAENVMDDAIRRFGPHTVTAAALMKKPGRMVDPRTEG